MWKECGARSATERGRSDVLEEQVTDLSSYVIMVKYVLRATTSNERHAVVEVKTLKYQRQSIAWHLRAMVSVVPGFQICVAGRREDGLMELCSTQFRSPTALFAA